MSPALFEAIDNYCERTGPGFWSEPLNALSNLAFIAAGIFGLVMVRRHRTGTFAELLAWWVILIGIGSGLFHTFANRLTVWLDILPIAFFTFAYTLFNLRRFFGFGWATAFFLFAGFYVLAGFLTWAVPEQLRAASNNSTGYLPALLGLLLFGAWLALRRHPAGKYDLSAAAIFVVSISFRASDFEVCETLPIGTHFLWHALNGLMLGVLMAAAARYGHPAADADGGPSAQADGQPGRLKGARSPKIAEPTRTEVAPKAIAFSKSPDMPMDNFPSPDRRASFSSKAKCGPGFSSAGGMHISPSRDSP